MSFRDTSAEVDAVADWLRDLTDQSHADGFNLGLQWTKDELDKFVRELSLDASRLMVQNEPDLAKTKLNSALGVVKAIKRLEKNLTDIARAE